MTDRRLAAVCLLGGLTTSMAANALMAPDVTAGANRMVAPIGQFLAFELLARGHRVVGWRRAVITVVGASVWGIGAAVSYGHIRAYVALTEEAWIATVYPALADLIMTMGGLYLLWAPAEAEPVIEPAVAVIPNPLPVQAPGPEAAVSPARLRAVPDTTEARPVRVAAAPVAAARATTTVPARPKPPARKWTAEHRARVLELAADGVAHTEIERTTGVPRTNIRRWTTAQSQEATA